MFLGFVLLMVLVSGTLMYVVEGPTHGFTSIPVAMYWAVATMTTVGFGDLVPKTDVGRLIASVMMLSGWGVLAVPTGIVSSEMAMQRRLVASPPGRRTAGCGALRRTVSAAAPSRLSARGPSYGDKVDSQARFKHQIGL